MPRTIPLSCLRNFGVIAHVDAGKTTLTERILLTTGRIHRAGGVDDGTTTTDFDPDERKRGITIGAAAVTCHWREHSLTLVDTPGHADFTLEVERSLRVLDGAIVVLDGVAGVEPQTEKVWRQAERHRVPRVVFVNKLDRAGADLDRAVASLRLVRCKPVVIAMPLGAERELEGVVDLVRFALEDGSMLPDAIREAATQRRQALIEACAEFDDAILADWIEGRVDEQRVWNALRRGTLERRIVPVLCGSAMRGIGVRSVLDAVVDLLPAPHESPALSCIATGENRDRSDARPLAALCFKISFDEHGASAFVRVYAGVLETGAMVHVASRRRLRVGRLVRLFGGEREPVSELRAGEIGALLGTELATGETLSDPDAPFLLESIQFPESVLRVSIEPRTRHDRNKLGEALRRLIVADPSLAIVSDAETGQTLLAGMGELHLEIAVGKLAREHGVEVAIGAPKVAYRETIARAAQVEVKHVKRTGGPGQYAHVILDVAPGELGSGLIFEDRTHGGSIPQAYVPGVRKGCENAAQSGVLAGYPVVDVRVVLLDGSFHSVDSSELAFQIAGQLAFREACRKAGPVLLEPWMRLDLSVPRDHVGDVVGDLSARRGRVLELRADDDHIAAEAPLSRLFRYATDLGSLTHGRGGFSMELARYAAVPEHLLEELLA